MKYDEKKLEEHIEDLSIPLEMKKNKLIEFIDDYLSGLTDRDLSDKYDVAERTIRTWLKELRDFNIIPYRSELDGGLVIKDKEIIQDKINEFIKDEPKNTANISKAELIKLLNIHGSRTAVANELGLSFKEISDLVDHYNILDNKSLSIKLNKLLNQLLKDFKVKQPEIKLKSSGTSVGLLLSDWHVGKLIKDEHGNKLYDTDEFNKRVDILIEQILKLLDRHMKSHLEVEEFVIFAVGDFANGEGIYPTQAFDQETAPPKQVMDSVYAFLKIINCVLQRGISVKFYGVMGNHGRLAKDADPLANWDLMIYKLIEFWQMVTKPKNFKMQYSERDYLNVNVRNWIYHIRHKAVNQDETSAGDSKFKGWKELHDADIILSGHFHHWGMNERGIMGGSLCGPDDLSERMAVSTGEPTQIIWVITDKYPHTNIFPIRVYKKRDE
jgi:predicted phosphodiesterase